MHVCMYNQSVILTLGVLYFLLSKVLHRKLHWFQHWSTCMKYDIGSVHSESHHLGKGPYFRACFLQLCIVSHFYCNSWFCLAFFCFFLYIVFYYIVIFKSLLICRRCT